VRLFERAGDAARDGYAHVQWARVLERLNRKREEAACLRACLALAPASQAAGVRAKAATLLAPTLAALGDDHGADEADRGALIEWHRLGKPTYEAQVANDLAHRAVERGELAKAEDLYLRALSLWQASGQPAGVAAALLRANLAGVYNLAGEPQMALDAANQGLAQWPREGPGATMAEILARKGEALADLGRRDESRSAFDAALKLCAPACAQLERRLARRAYEDGDLDEAARRFQSALSTFEAEQELSSATATLQDLAWTELKRGHLDAAQRLFERTSTASRSSENRWMKAASLAGRARLEQARGHLAPALALALQGLDEVEGLRQQLGRTDLKTAVFANQQPYFHLAAELTLELFRRAGDPSLLVAAFEISERSRARRMLDLLAAGSTPAGGPRPRQQATFAAAALDRSDERLEALRAAGAPAGQIDDAEQQLRHAVLTLRRLESRSATAPPGLPGTPLTLRQIRPWIGDDSVLLEYDIGENASYLWVVSRRQLVVHRLPGAAEVESAARRAVAVLSAQGAAADSIQGRQTLLAAARLLVGPAMPELAAARRWVVVLDGALHMLPLGALPDPAHPEEPLLARREISYAPSASVAVRLSERAVTATPDRRRGAPSGKLLAVIADPVYETENGAPQAQPAPAGGLLHLPRLRFAAEEARRTLAMVPPAARLDAQRFAATKERVLAGELAAYRLLHFAVHGLPDENHPELSALALSLFDRQGRPLDGMLFAHEIARLDLAADLVVLSACKSGRGAVLSGEGLVGLVQAFFTAGAARVVASDWAVNDQATTELMGLFYDGLLRRGLSPAHALQQAQLALAARQPWRHPYYWAAFIVQGGF
jgi:CHAT domain-containing protein